MICDAISDDVFSTECFPLCFKVLQLVETAEIFKGNKAFTLGSLVHYCNYKLEFSFRS